MQFLNPKALGVFIDYTIKPLIEDARDLLDALDEKGFKKEDLKLVFWLFVLQMLFDFAKTLLVTGMICWTLLSVLSRYPNILR